MADKADTPKAAPARRRSAKPAEPPAQAADTTTEEDEAAQQRPLPDRAELEQLRARLIAQYRGRR
jgi:hypothetical protein